MNSRYKARSKLLELPRPSPGTARPRDPPKCARSLSSTRWDWLSGPAYLGGPAPQGNPEAVVRPPRALQLSFRLAWFCERGCCRTRACNMSVPAFIDISEEDQVCSQAASASKTGLGETQGYEGLSQGQAGGTPRRGARSGAESRRSLRTQDSREGGRP